ncbi:MAG: hypothetical protein WA118_05850 [Carboxydocellales bacterium]
MAITKSSTYDKYACGFVIAIFVLDEFFNKPAWGLGIAVFEQPTLA